MSNTYDITNRNPEFSETTLRGQASGSTKAGNTLNFWALAKENLIEVCEAQGVPPGKAYDNRGGLVPKPIDRNDRSKGEYWFGVVKRNGKWVEIGQSNQNTLTKEETDEGFQRGRTNRTNAIKKALDQLNARYGHPVLGAMASYWCNRLIPRDGRPASNSQELPIQNAAIDAYWREHQASGNVEGAAQLYSDLKYINQDADAGRKLVLTIPDDLPKWLREQFVAEAEKSGRLYDTLINRIETERLRDPDNEDILDLAIERLRVHERQVAESGSLVDKTMMFMHGANREGFDKADPELYNQLQLSMAMEVARNKFFSPNAKVTSRLHEANPDDGNDRSPEAEHLRMQSPEATYGLPTGLTPRLAKYEPNAERKRIAPHLVRQVREGIIELLRIRGQEFEPSNPAAKPMNYHDWIFAQGPEHLLADVQRIYEYLVQKYPSTWGKDARMAWIVNYVVHSLAKTRGARSDLMTLARANQPAEDAQPVAQGVSNEPVFLGD